LDRHGLGECLVELKVTHSKFTDRPSGSNGTHTHTHARTRTSVHPTHARDPSQAAASERILVPLTYARNAAQPERKTCRHAMTYRHRQASRPQWPPLPACLAVLTLAGLVLAHSLHTGRPVPLSRSLPSSKSKRAGLARADMLPKPSYEKGTAVLGAQLPESDRQTDQTPQDDAIRSIPGHTHDE